MKKIFLITSSFPYVGGEQFLETEINYYTQYRDIELTILPLKPFGESREIDPSIKIEQLFKGVRGRSILTKFSTIMQSMGSRVFYKELFHLNRLNVKVIKSFLSSLSVYQHYLSILDHYLSHQEDLKESIFYTYWHNEATYALQTLKSKYGYTLVSRIHGGDLYQERKSDGYMPLKWQFIDNIDTIYIITKSANSYLRDTYGFKQDTLLLSRLGVEDRNIVSQRSDGHRVHLVSCAFLSRVKRVDKIIDALSFIESKITFEWTHIGGGELLEVLKHYANQKLSHKKNILFKFVGNLDNAEIYNFYKENRVDLFINSSEFEGVPVSIMEAMSCRIPIIAPNIGGVSDMIKSRKSGLLLSKECTISEIQSALKSVALFKRKETRECAYQIYKERYDASINYPSFIDSMIGNG
jgi:colanic acid/amylovoran biosynthesis glycosyltransferase